MLKLIKFSFFRNNQNVENYSFAVSCCLLCISSSSRATCCKLIKVSRIAVVNFAFFCRLTWPTQNLRTQLSSPTARGNTHGPRNFQSQPDSTMTQKPLPISLKKAGSQTRKTPFSPEKLRKSTEAKSSKSSATLVSKRESKP